MSDSPTPKPTPQPLQTLLAAKRPSLGRRLRVAALVALALLGLFAGFSLWQQNRVKPARFVSTALQRGDLEVRVTATGTLQPTNQVDVGSELSGRVAEVRVDFNDRVRKGQVLARLDTRNLLQQIERSRASLASAKAKVLQARASADEAQAKLARQEELARISAGKLPSPSELDSARANLSAARAQLAVANADVSAATATLESNETELSKAEIRSPVDGVVLKRNVSPGQTVAASLQAPVLFTLAEDLTQMQLLVNLAEADVGAVSEGQEASFSVDAWPEQRFPAKVIQVRYGAKTVDNVVSYETLLNASNAALRLRPGMSATAEILVATRQDVWRVPNAALRFQPRQAREQKAAGGLLGNLMPRPPGMGGAPAPRPRANKADGGPASAGSARIWVVQGSGEARPIKVKRGLSDGRFTEISGEGLNADLLVITAALGDKAAP